MRMGPGNDGEAPLANVLLAIRHGIAAGACRVAAREKGTQRVHWDALADDQSKKSGERLHQATSRYSRRCSAVAASAVTERSR